MLVLWKEDTRGTREKPSKQAHEPTTNSTHMYMWCQVCKTKPRPHQQEVSAPPPLPFYPFVPPLLVSTNKRLKKIDFKEVWVHFQIVTLNCSSCTLKLRKLIHTCLASCGWVQSTHLRNLVNAWELKENSSKKFFNYQVLIISFWFHLQVHLSNKITFTGLISTCHLFLISEVKSELPH